MPDRYTGSDFSNGQASFTPNPPGYSILPTGWKNKIAIPVMDPYFGTIV
jgi:hypothetical protein